MRRWNTASVVLALVTLVFAAFALSVWIPNDVAGQPINYVRRRYSIGDPFAPILAVLLLGIAGMGLLVSSLLRGGEDHQPKEHSFSRLSLLYGLGVASVLAACFALMRWGGPWLVGLVGPDKRYAQLVTTLPWNILGFLLGGSALVLAQLVAVERRISLRALLVALGVPVVIALAYDVPFSLILPPNGRLDAG